MTAKVDRSALAERGWTVTELLGPAEVAAARRVVDELALPDDHPFFASPAQAWGSVARAVDARLKALTAPRLAELVPGHRPFLAGVTSKGTGTDLVIKFHHDWTYTDERVCRPVFLWCPLVDVDEGNGCLAVVEGSHRWSGGIRPSRHEEAAETLQAELGERAVPVPLRAGQALVFDPGVFHGSGPNRSAATRPAFTVAVVPDGAPLLHFHEHPDGRLEGFVVDDAFFTVNPYRTRPEGYEAIEPYAPAVQRADLVAALAAAPAPAPARR